VTRSSATPWLEAIGHAAFAIVAALLLAAAAQPLQTDDAWWHLALGRAYAAHGPWLESDPLLHTAAGPPAPAAWLADLTLYAVGEATGFVGLRTVHALLLLSILLLAWGLLHRASASRSLASVGAAAFAALAAYRVFQLRPELATILATLLLYRWLLEGPAPPSRRRVAMGVALLLLWANLHSGFLLGPILLGAAIGGLLVGAAIGPPDARRADLLRARRLAWALGLGLAATLLNPDGVGQHLAYFRAGSETPELARVADEWARVDLFRLPVANLPPSPLAWGLVWALLLSAAPVVAAGVLHRLRKVPSGRAPADPALAGIALVSLVGMLFAVRFLWLGIFPLLLVARSLRAAPGQGRRALAVAVVAVLIVPAFVRSGDWRLISGTIPRSWSEYAGPFLTAKYHVGSVWLMADAKLEGKLWNEYFLGGFLGYWLAPQAREFVNGSLNLPREALAAQVALQRGEGLSPDEGFLALLDRYEVDLFFGIGLPQVPRANRPWLYSTGHLERAPGWIPIYRDLHGAVYLRVLPRNRDNLARVAAHYAREGVPFDEERGFDPAAVIRAAPDWAVAHGLVPPDFASLEDDVSGPDPARKRWALDRLASIWLALGVYDESIAIDRRLLRSNPGANAPTRRLVWALLREDRTQEAREAARGLARARDGGISAMLAAAARSTEAAVDPDERIGRTARLPVFTRSEASQIASGLAERPSRPWRE